MILYRISGENYASDLTGEGAFRIGGRWNSKGHRAIYTAQHQATCLLEKLVHLGRDASGRLIVPVNYALVTINLSDEARVSRVRSEDLPPNWRDNPYHTQSIGDDFLLGQKHAALIVPSAVAQLENNVIINPAFAFAITIVAIEKLYVDTRLIR
jgi:RES domain-containing protein